MGAGGRAPTRPRTRVIRDVSLFCVIRWIGGAGIVNSFKYMKGTHTNSGKDKRKIRTKVSNSADPLTREHSRRHGKAVKSGIKKAKQLLRSCTAYRIHEICRNPRLEQVFMSFETVLFS